MTRAHYKSLAERRLAQIKKLTKELQIEKRLNNALSKLNFLPAEKQNPARLRNVRTATTLKNNLANKKAA